MAVSFLSPLAKELQFFGRCKREKDDYDGIHLDIE